MARREEKDGKLSKEESREGITLENYKPLKVPATYGTEWEQLINPPTFADLVRKVRVRGIMDKYDKRREERNRPVTQEQLDKAAEDLRSFRSDKSLLTEEGTGKAKENQSLYDQAYDRAEKEYNNLTGRRNLARGLRDLYMRGALTADYLKQARNRADELGIDPLDFQSFMDKHNIKPLRSDSLFETSTDAQSSSPYEAAENAVYYRDNAGGVPFAGLKQLKAMQDPNYEVGAIADYNRQSRPFGRKSSALLRAAEKLRDKKFTAAANQVASLAASKMVNEPSITTPASKAQEDAQDIIAGRLARQQMDEAASYTANRRTAADQRAAKRRAEEEKRSKSRNS